jgi:hypothetical protein
MLNSVDVKTVYVFDKEEIDAGLEGRITLGMSDDDKVHYWNLYADGDTRNHQLSLIDYTGRILLPINTDIHINTIKTIDGKIASPAYIEGDGNINLTIVPESNLELCISSFCPVIINNEILQSGHPFYSGLTFEHYEKRYTEYLQDQLNKKTGGKIPDKFTEHPTKPSIQDVCLYFNLVYIKKDEGIINIKYNIPKHDTQQDNELHAKKRLYTRLKREIIEAYKTENYEVIPSTQKRLEILESEINIANEKLNKN